MSLSNPFPARKVRHPHSRKLPQHARHVIRQMLKARVAPRASVLQAHARQLDSAVNLSEHPDRVHPDSDRHSPGVRVVVGPATRSLLRQLLASRDLRVQQQLVREVLHQIQKLTLSALRRVRAAEKARAAGERAARSVRRHAGAAWTWLAGRSHWVRDKVTGRSVRVVGGRKPAVRTRGPQPAARARKPASKRPERDPAARARTSRTARGE